jgi:putative transposase
MVIADKGYDANSLVDALAQRGIDAIIPSRINRFDQRPYSKILYRLRNRIERFFNRLKHFRRIATRYEKLALHYQGIVLLGAILLHIRL